MFLVGLRHLVSMLENIYFFLTHKKARVFSLRNFQSSPKFCQFLQSLPKWSTFEVLT
jgi:hypothetical protein